MCQQEIEILTVVWLGIDQRIWIEEILLFSTPPHQRILQYLLQVVFHQEYLTLQKLVRNSVLKTNLEQLLPYHEEDISTLDT